MAKYKIKRNRHYHSNLCQRIRFLVKKKQQHYTVQFTDSCWYPEDKVKKPGFNRLFGMGSLNPKDNSARIVWLPDFENENHFNLFTFVYENWQRKDPEFLTAVKVNERFDAMISVDDNKYIIRVNDIENTQPHNKIKTRFRLQPYFGVKDKAYHAMMINMDEV